MTQPVVRRLGDDGDDVLDFLLDPEVGRCGQGEHGAGAARGGHVLHDDGPEQPFGHRVAVQVTLTQPDVRGRVGRVGRVASLMPRQISSTTAS